MSSSSRWDWLAGLELETAETVAVRELGKILADELCDWPPRISDDAAAEDSRFSEVLSAGGRHPSLAAYREAIKRVGWELERDFDAIDFYERNHGLAKACSDAFDRGASELIQHYILEAYYDLMERTDYRIKRADVLSGLGDFERRMMRLVDGSR